MRVSKSPDERREEIIRTAKELFSSNGFLKTSVSDIAQKTGIAKGLVYYYFKTKDDVVNAVMEDYISETVRQVREIVRQKDGDIQERITRSIITIVDILKQAENVFDQNRNADQYMFHQSVLEHTVSKLRGLLYELADEGVEKGVIRCSHPHLTIEVLLYGFGMADFRSLEKIQIVEVAEQALCITQ